VGGKAEAREYGRGGEGGAEGAEGLIKPVLQGNSLIVDIVTACKDRLHLWWVGQSGYVIGWNKHCIAIDLYLSDSLTTKYAQSDKPHVRMSERVIRPAGLVFANLKGVFATHHHTDHLDPDTLAPLVREWPFVTLVVPEAHRKLAADRSKSEHIVGANSGTTGKLGDFEFLAVPAAHPRLDQDENGNFKCLGYIIGAGPYRIFHSGDTLAFEGMAERLRPHNIDIAILPINGKLDNMNGTEAARLAKDIGVKLVIPCHYDMFEFNTADPYEQFVPECERIGQPYQVLKLGERFTFQP
jgi:L-ascorbate metabolism protein UlaG (beta-lactamase superfamily)